MAAAAGRVSVVTITVFTFLFLCLSGVAPAMAAGVVLFSPEPQAPVSVQDGATRMNLEFREGRWWVTTDGGREQLADRAQVRELLAVLVSLVTERTLTERGRPREGAFDAPTIINWGEQRVEIGGESRIPGLVYARLPDGSLHLMERPQLPLPRGGVVNRHLFPEDMDKVREIDISGADLALHAVLAGDAWRLTAPAVSPAETDAVAAWLRLLNALSGDPVSAPEGKPAFFDVILTDDAGKTESFALSREGYVRTGKLLFRTDPVRGKLLPSHMDWLLKQVVSINDSDITGFEVESGDSTRGFLRRSGNWTDRDSGTVYRRWAEEMLQMIAPLKAISARMGDTGSLGESMMEVRLWKGKKNVTSLEFWLDDEGRWWVHGGETDLLYEIKPDLPLHLTILF